MTTVITRLFATRREAEQAIEALRLQNIPETAIRLVAASNSAREAMIEARVPEASADAYAEALQAGQAVVVVCVGLNPFGAALSTRYTFDEFDTLDAGVETEEAYIVEKPDPELYIDLKVDRKHRRFLSP